MKSTALKIAALLLALLMIVPAVAACSESTGGDTSETTAASANVESVTETEELTPLEARKAISDDLPAADYGGRAFRVGTDADKEYEIYVEELTGTNTNDAIFNRNRAIEDRFNVTIESVVVDAPYDNVKTVVTSGDDAYDIVSMWNFKVYTPVNAGVLQNWMNVGTVNFEKPWHNQLSNTNSTIFGKLYAATGDLSISSLMYTYGMFFNQELAQDYGYDTKTLYDLVFSGEWTVDKFYEITQGIYNDVNGDSKVDANDVVGYTVYLGLNTTDVWLAALDLTVTLPDEENGISVEFFNERSITGLEKIIDLCYNNTGCFLNTQDWRSVPKYFAQGNVAFTQLYFGEAFADLTTMENTYGILPLPKLDETQENYYTNAWDQYTMFCIPKTATDLDFIGTMYEVMNAESYKTVYPEYYDVALKSRYSSDQTVADIIDLIMEGRKFEFSFQFGEQLANLPYTFRRQLAAQNSDLASYYAKMQKSMNKSLEKVVNLYIEDDN